MWRGGGGGNRECYNCGEIGHVSRDCNHSRTPTNGRDADTYERTPTYGPQDLYLKDEPPKEEEELEIKQIVYRCPHKRDEGGRCNSKDTDFNLLLNHFYKHHAKERLLSIAQPKFTMCCFRTDCTSKFSEHSELVKHMYKHDKDPAENIYFVSYIKQLYENENKDLDLQVKGFTEEVKNLQQKITDLNNQEIEVNKLEKENKDTDRQLEKFKKDVKKLKDEKLELQQKIKDFNKQEIELKDLKKDKQYYKEKYSNEKAKNREHMVNIEQHQKTIENQLQTIEEQKETKNKEHIAAIEHHKKTIKNQLKIIDFKQEIIRERDTKIDLKDDQNINNLGKIKELETQIKELKSQIEKTPTSTSTNEDDTNKKLEKKDEKIDDLKRREKILIEEVAKLNNQVLEWKLKKGGYSTDSDTSSNLEKRCKIGKQKRKHPESSTSSEKVREEVENEFSETENSSENCSTRKKKCSLNVSSQSEYKEDNETDTNLEQEEYVEDDHEPWIKPDGN